MQYWIAPPEIISEKRFENILGYWTAVEMPDNITCIDSEKQHLELLALRAEELMKQETLCEAINRIYSAREEWEWKDPLVNLDRPKKNPLDLGRANSIRRHWAEGATINHPMTRLHLQVGFLGPIYPLYPVTGETAKEVEELIRETDLSQWISYLTILPIAPLGTMD